MAEPRKPFDLRRSKPPPPPPAAPQAAPATSGGFRQRPGFLPVGQPIAAEHLTPFERQQYEKLGIQPGTTVAGSLGEVVQAIRAETDPDDPFGLGKNFEVGKPQTVEIDDLTPEQKTRVRAAIDLAAEQARQIREIPQLQNAGAGVNEAIAKATILGMQQEQDRPAERLIANQSATPSPLRAGAIPAGGVYAHQGRVDELPEEAIPRPAPQAPPPPEPPPGKMTDTGAGDARYCPHCGWDQSVRDGIEATHADKYTFLWSVLGGPDKRFTKQFELMGGKVLLNFRTLTSREADLTLRQVASDYRAGLLASDLNWFQRWMDYRMSFGLESIAIEGTGKTYVGPMTLDEIEYDRPTDAEGHELPGTPFPALWEHLERDHLYNESFRKAVSMAYASFVDLTRKMEDNYDNRDFWQGIGAPA